MIVALLRHPFLSIVEDTAIYSAWPLCVLVFMVGLLEISIFHLLAISLNTQESKNLN